MSDLGGDPACWADEVCPACGAVRAGCRCTRAIVAFPTGADLTRIEAHRAVHDPLAGTIDAHLTLVFPFAGAVDLEALAERAAAGMEPFQLVLAAVEAHDDHVLLVASAGNAEATRLHDALYSGPLAGHLSDQAYVPHLTVARGPIGTAVELVPAVLEVGSISVCTVPVTGRVQIDATFALG
jgi:2'-5' RNA ligase